MKNILVAVDDFETASVESPLVVKTIELANVFSSKVWMLHVAPPVKHTPFNIDKDVFRHEVAQELRKEHSLLQQLAKSLRERDVDASALMVEGTTIKTILEESDRLKIDLIILGCHRHSELVGTITKNTENGLLGKCSIPILFIPLPD